MPCLAARRVLLERMRAQVAAHAGRTAVRASCGSVTYGDFGRLIGWFCREFRRPGRARHGPVGLLLDRSVTAYAAMWAAIAVGRPYVPLNPRYPLTRLQSIVRQAGAKVAVCTEPGRKMLACLGIAPGNAIVADTRVPAGGTGVTPLEWSQSERDEGSAYILFTSGSTGEPKGVPISYDNLHRFIGNLDSTIAYAPEDVCSQVCELSFDLSVHEIYLALLNGCTLCPAREIDLFNPARYVAGNGITVWVSVPSLARVALHNGQALGEALRTLRLSMFNGEALPDRLAGAWQAAARNSEIWNTYGPTECTVAVTAQRWRNDPDLTEAGVVSLGTAFPDCTAALLVDGDIVPLSPERSGLAGELLLATPQRFDGYLDPHLPPPLVTKHDGQTYYRTGDRVLARGGRLFYLERLDLQVKIGGHRIELLEIEHRLRERLGTDALAVIAHPRRHPTQLVLFLTGRHKAPRLTGEALGLPNYMVPRRCIVVDSLPVTTHGKLDRDGLHERIAADP